MKPSQCRQLCAVYSVSVCRESRPHDPADRGGDGSRHLSLSLHHPSCPTKAAPPRSGRRSRPGSTAPALTDSLRWLDSTVLPTPFTPCHHQLTIAHLGAYRRPLTIVHLPSSFHHCTLTIARSPPPAYHRPLTTAPLPLPAYHRLLPPPAYHRPLATAHLPSSFQHCIPTTALSPSPA